MCGKYRWEKGGWDVLHSIWFSEKPCSLYLCVKHLFSTGGWRGAASFSAFLRSCSSFFLAWPFWSWFLKKCSKCTPNGKTYHFVTCVLSHFKKNPSSGLSGLGLFLRLQASLHGIPALFLCSSLFFTLLLSLLSSCEEIIEPLAVVILLVLLHGN